jgi:hypothetical protein
LCGATVSGAKLIAGVATDTNRAASHFTTAPIAGVACDVNLAAAEFAADVPAGRSVNVDLPIPHVGTNPMDTGKFPFEIEPLVAGVASD